MPNFPIVDPHLHIWDTGVFHYPWLEAIPKLDRSFSLQDYDRACGSVEVDAMVFVQCEVDRASFLQEAEWVSSQAEADPRIKALVTWAPLYKGSRVSEDLDKLRENPLLRGVRQIIEFESDPDFCLQPAFIEGVNTLTQYGLSFDICINYKQLPKLVQFVRQCPDVPMVLDHVGKPGVRDSDLHPWRDQFRELADCQNVVCKLSSLPTEADHDSWSDAQIRPFIDTTIECFGFDRVMFAGDWPVSSQAVGYEQWVALVDDALSGVSDDHLVKLYRKNAIDFYRMDVA